MFCSKKLKKFKNIKHYFFSRNNGFSKGLYKSLNCGRGSGDKKVNIKKNLKYIAKKMNINCQNLILMHQTHSNKVIEIKSGRKKIYGDAMITKNKKFALGVVTADCVPILLFDKRNKVIGCIHAGWKGAFNGIIEKTIKSIKKIGTENEIFASVGPCIGKYSYEVDISFYKMFLEKSKKNRNYFLNKNKTKKYFDIRKFVHNKLLNLKVKVDHINRDTYKEKKNFFSFRRSLKLKQNDYGRCISVISMI